MRGHQQLRVRLVLLQQRFRSAVIVLVYMLPICNLPISAAAKPVASAVAAVASVVSRFRGLLA